MNWPTTRRLLAASALLGAVALSVWAVAPASQRRWTDDRTIDVAESINGPRDILWTPPLSVERPGEGSDKDQVDEYEPRVSADGMTMVFVRRKAGENADLVVAQWTPNGWSQAAQLDSVNTDADELGPDLSPDGLLLTFYSDRDGGLGGYDLWQCARPSSEAPWGEAKNLGPTVNSVANEYGPSRTPDGTRLYFSSNRPRSEETTPTGDHWTATLRERRARHDYDLYVCSCAGGEAWAEATRIDRLSTTADEGAPAVSPSGDFLYFASDRSGGAGGLDLYRVRLAPTSLVADTATVEALGAPINSAANELDPALASEGFRLYFASDRVGDQYGLFTSTSREVRAIDRSEPIDWASWWAGLWPWLLLLSLLALLAYLLAKLIAHQDQWRKRVGAMGLLARCLLASVLLHLLIAALLAAWKVGGAIADSLRGGGHRVILASSGLDSARGELAEQIRAHVESLVPIQERSITPLTVTSPSVTADRPADLTPPPSMSEPAFLSHVRSIPGETAVERTPPQLAERAPDATPNAPAAAAPIARSEKSAELRANVPAELAELVPTEGTITPATSVVVAMPLTPMQERTSNAPAELSMQLANEAGSRPASSAASLPMTSGASLTLDSRPPSAPPAATTSEEHRAAPLSSMRMEVPTLTAAPTASSSLTAPPAEAAAPALPSAMTIDSLPLAASIPTMMSAEPTAASLVAPQLPEATSSAQQSGESRLPELPTPLEDFAQRDPSTRDELIDQMGGSDETERAVAKALEWLTRHQESDGRWSSRRHGGSVDADAAMTGLALLTYLGAGHTHQESGPYQEAVARALAWLRTRQSSDGDVRTSATRGVADDTMYGQTIATVALCEAYSMTRDPSLAASARSAVQFVLHQAARARQGRVAAADTAVLGWLVVAVESARRAGFAPPSDVFESARAWLDSVAVSAGRGQYAYASGDRPSPAMTAEAMFVQQLLGHHGDEPRMLESATFVADTLPSWSGGAPTHHWYYATLALFQQQGPTWARWNEALTRELLGHQRQDGAAAGSWDPQDRWSRTGGRVYQTAVCALSLEVYYRYRIASGSEGGSAAQGPVPPAN
jgi:hypothetical protein